MRDKTERTEALAGTVKLVGIDVEQIMRRGSVAFNPENYAQMSLADNHMVTVTLVKQY